MELCILIRHAESTHNVAHLVNGDPSVEVGLSRRGAEQARALAAKLDRFAIEACFHSRFPRARQTASLALAETEPAVPLHCEPLVDDIVCGEMEGWSVYDDHSWRACRGRDSRPPGGESVRDAALRIARGLERISARPERTVAVVTHELVVRYALNAVGGSADISRPWREIPNATPFAIRREALDAATHRIRTVALGPWGRAVPTVDANGG